MHWGCGRRPDPAKRLSFSNFIRPSRTFVLRSAEQAVLQGSDWIGIEFALDCEEFGITLSVPTVTLSGTAPPSGDATATATATSNANTEDAPTGIPSNFYTPSTTGAASTSSVNPISNEDRAVTKTSPKKTETPQAGPQSSTTGKNGTSGAIRVGNRAGVLCELFSVCLTVVLVV